jgi:hypothetical protein
MGNIKLLLLSVFFVGQLAFACGTTITGGGAGSTQQTNTSSPCPNTTSQASTTPVYNTSYSPSYSSKAYADEQAAKDAAEKAKIEAKRKWCKENNYSAPMCEPYYKEAQLKKKCAEAPAQIPIAVRSCEIAARNYRQTLVGYSCGDSRSTSWDFSFNVKDVINIGYTATVSNEYCRQDIDYATETTILMCENEGAKASSNLQIECSGVSN